MANRVSPFAALTGAEKQIKWLEYQSVKLPYIQSGVEDVLPPQEKRQEKRKPVAPARRESAVKRDLPVPPPEVPRGPMPQRSDFQRSRHSQYDAVIARLKQAELQTGGKYHSMS